MNVRTVLLRVAVHRSQMTLNLTQEQYCGKKTLYEAPRYSLHRNVVNSKIPKFLNSTLFVYNNLELSTTRCYLQALEDFAFENIQQSP
jgi:hypothetical protein